MIHPCFRPSQPPATTIATPGVYCLKQEATAIETGTAVSIASNIVTLDYGYRLGGLQAGDDTLAVGISASNRPNITVRNGNIRGFFRGIHLSGMPRPALAHR